MSHATADTPRVPLQLIRGCVVASVQVELNDEVLHRFQHDLLEALRVSRAHTAILDLSGVEVLDSTDFESIRRTLAMAVLMGARPVLVGLRAGIAAALVELGADVEGLMTCRSLETAFEAIERTNASRP